MSGRRRSRRVPPPTSPCEEVTLWARGGRAAAGDDGVLELHVESCPRCRERFPELRALMAAKPVGEAFSTLPPVSVTVWRFRLRDAVVAAVLFVALQLTATAPPEDVSEGRAPSPPRIGGRPVTAASVRLEKVRRGFGERRFASLVRSGPVSFPGGRRAMQWESP